MRRTSFSDAECPIARALDVIGDPWSILLLRDALDGSTRFDQFERNLGIAPNMLTRRLRTLVEHDLLGRHRYQDRPPRYEYLLTERGRATQPVIIALAQWADREVPSVLRGIQLVNTETGATLDPVLVDRTTGRPISELPAGYAAGPAASPALRARFDSLRPAPAAPNPTRPR
jgi:DNA-binding HxlR family transcriptional regulator